MARSTACESFKYCGLFGWWSLRKGLQLMTLVNAVVSLLLIGWFSYISYCLGDVVNMLGPKHASISEFDLYLTLSLLGVVFFLVWLVTAILFFFFGVSTKRGINFSCYIWLWCNPAIFVLTSINYFVIPPEILLWGSPDYLIYLLWTVTGLVLFYQIYTFWVVNSFITKLGGGGADGRRRGRGRRSPKSGKKRRGLTPASSGFDSSSDTTYPKNKRKRKRKAKTKSKDKSQKSLKSKSKTKSGSSKTKKGNK